MAHDGDHAYERPAVSDFGSLWDNTFMNMGGHGKPMGSHAPDAFGELVGNDGS